ncbi:MAG: alpha/beta hydrolase [Ignavibacteriales bacterium]|nr:alpha/beta hydrolase [Ignavibacteriales bacterium]
MMYIVLVIIVVIILVIILMPGYTQRIKKLGNVQGQKSLTELKKIRIGDSLQWVMIRSENIDNPILLFIHGGPGTSQLTQMKNNTQPIEKYFTVVNWDQRGAGKSYSAIRDKSRMNIDQFVSDINELSEYLAKRFNRNKIILVGHSWGSVISMLAVSQRPELYSAYIGIGQMSNVMESEKISYEWTLQQAKLSNDVNAIKKLIDMGIPPYQGAWRKKFMAQRQILGKYGGEYYGSKIGAFGSVIKNLVLSTEYTFVDRINFFRGIFESVELLFPELMKVNLFEQAVELKVPVWFMLGRHDCEVPSVLSAKYFDFLKAPYKKLFWFENSSHLPNTEERELFNQLLVDEILPTIKISESKSLG